MMTNRQIGDIGEACVIAKFVQLNIPVFIPFNDPGDIDIIAYFNNKLNRIQIKTSALKRKNHYTTKLTSTRNNIRNSQKHKYTKDEIDYFAIYNLTRQKVLLIPVEATENKTEISIHISLTQAEKEKYSKIGKVWLEEDWLIEKILNKPIQEDLCDRYVCPSCGTEMDTYNDSTIKHFCIDCGKPISKRAKRCQACEAIFRVKQKQELQEGIAPKEELKELVRNNSILSVAKMFDVSESTIRNWCENYGLPRRATIIKSLSDEEWEKL